MQSDTLLNSEDEGMSQLLMLNDLVNNIIDNRNLIHNGITQEPETPSISAAGITVYIYNSSTKI